MSQFPFTTLRWYNDVDGGKIACISGSYEDIPFGAHVTREFHAEGRPPHAEHGQFQEGIACSRTSRTIVIDIDHPEEWDSGDAYVELGELRDIATSVREDAARVHVVLTVPENLLHLWPKQGPARWGDVKSNGFSYIEGVHYTGLRYVQTGEPLEATAEVLEALTRDRIFPQGGREGTASGTMAGPWQDDAYRITSHDECVATVMSMVRAGLTDAEVTERLEVIMPNREGSWPGRDAYIAEKIRSANRKSDQIDSEARRLWESWAGIPYDELAARVHAAQAEAVRERPVRETQQEAAELGEHAVAIGQPLSSLPVGVRLNPQGHVFEPAAVNDTALGRLTAQYAVVNFRLSADEGCWLENTGTHWQRWGTKSERLERAAVIAMALGDYLKTEAQLKEEIGAQGTASDQADIDADESRRERLVKARGRFRGTAGQAAIGKALVAHFLTDPGFSVTTASLDDEADVLWAGGHPWSLLHPELTLATDVRQVNPVHLKTALCLPVPGPAPAFDRLLAAVLPDAALREWALREMAGLFLWGATSKMHPVLDGPPQAGKSTLSHIFLTVLGSYAIQVVPEKILGQDSTSAVEEEIAAMMGARMVWMDEPPPGGKQAISRFNDMASGTGNLSASRKYNNRVTAPKLFNFLICQNPRNALRMDAQGVGERIIHVPCEGTPESTNEARLNWLRSGESEYPAILARLIRECALHRTGHRFPVPLAAQMGRASAQVRSDEFGTWVLDNFDRLPDDITTTDARLDSSPTVGALRTQYNGTHARDNGLPKIGAAEAKDQLARMGIRVAYGGSRRLRDTVFIQPKPMTQHSWR